MSGHKLPSRSLPLTSLCVKAFYSGSDDDAECFIKGTNTVILGRHRSIFCTEVVEFVRDVSSINASDAFQRRVIPKHLCPLIVASSEFPLPDHNICTKQISASPFQSSSSAVVTSAVTNVNTVIQNDEAKSILTFSP